MANYTLSKFMQTINLLNGSDAEPVREISDIVGGWQLSGIWSYQMGFPIGWGNVICLHPEKIRLPKDRRTTDQYFNTAPFDTNTADQLVSNLRTFPLRSPQIRQPSTGYVDLSPIRNTRIREETETRFRCEALNAFSHPILSSNSYPNIRTGVTSATFGQIVGSNQAGYPRRLRISFKFIFQPG
jgi:hypothetical protein